MNRNKLQIAVAEARRFAETGTMMTSEREAVEANVEDHLRNLIQLMKRGARVKLFDIPDDPSLLSSHFGGRMSQAIAERLEAALSAAEPVASIVPEHCSGSALSFEGGCLHVRKDGSGYIVVDEDDFVLEDDRCEGEHGPEGSVHWIARFAAGEMNALRDFLNGQGFSTLSAQVQDVAGWERIAIETGRKSGTSHADVWPDGEGWEIDTDRGRVNTPDAGWDRFSHHEELYFRRRANDLPAAPAKQEGGE